MPSFQYSGRYEEARAISEETLAKAKNDYKIWTMHGKILFYSRNYRDAEKALTKALALKSDNEDAKSFRLSVYGSQSNLVCPSHLWGKTLNNTLQRYIILD